MLMGNALRDRETYSTAQLAGFVAARPVEGFSELLVNR